MDNITITAEEYGVLLRSANALRYLIAQIEPTPCCTDYTASLRRSFNYQNAKETNADYVRYLLKYELPDVEEE